MSWGVWNKIKKGLTKAFNWTKDKIVKPAINVAKKVVAPIVSAKGKVLNMSGDILGKVMPGPLGQFAQTAGKAWGVVGNIADRFAKS